MWINNDFSISLQSLVIFQYASPNPDWNRAVEQGSEANYIVTRQINDASDSELN